MYLRICTFSVAKKTCLKLRPPHNPGNRKTCLKFWPTLYIKGFTYILRNLSNFDRRPFCEKSFLPICSLETISAYSNENAFCYSLTFECLTRNFRWDPVSIRFFEIHKVCKLNFCYLISRK